MVVITMGISRAIAKDNRNMRWPELLNALAWQSRSSGKISRMGRCRPDVGSWQVLARAL